MNEQKRFRLMAKRWRGQKPKRPPEKIEPPVIRTYTCTWTEESRLGSSIADSTDEPINPSKYRECREYDSTDGR